MGQKYDAKVQNSVVRKKRLEYDVNISYMMQQGTDEVRQLVMKIVP